MNILIFGASIVQGFNDCEKAGWVNRLFVDCVRKNLSPESRKFVSIFNLGVSGDRSCDLVKRFETEFLARKGSEVVTIIAVGINDSARNVASGENWCSLSDYRDNVNTMVSIAQPHGKVVLIGLSDIQEDKLVPIPWFSEYAHYQNDRDMYDVELDRIASEKGHLFISLTGLFEENKEELLTDGLHPNAEGHRLIFERVKETLEKEGILKENISY